MGTRGPHFTGAHTEAVLLLSLAPHLTVAPNERCKKEIPFALEIYSLFFT